MIKKLWIHFETSDGRGIFNDFTSRQEAIEFINSFEEEIDGAETAHYDKELSKLNNKI